MKEKQEERKEYEVKKTETISERIEARNKEEAIRKAKARVWNWKRSQQDVTVTKVLSKEKQPKRTGKIGKCPICGSNNLHYLSLEPQEDVVYYPFNCNNCGASGKEVYDLKNGRTVKEWKRTDSNE